MALPPTPCTGKWVLPAAALIWVLGRRGGARGREPLAPRAARPCRGPPALPPPLPPPRTARRVLAAVAARVGGSLTWGWAKGAGAGGDAEPRAGAGVGGQGAHCATVLAPHPGPAHGGRHKGAFHAPLQHCGGCPGTLSLMPRWGQHPQGLPEGSGGAAPSVGCPWQAGATAGSSRV